MSAFTCGWGSGCEPGRQVEQAVRHLIIVGWSFHLQIDLAVNNVHDVATDPDVFDLLAQMDAAGALEGCDLGRGRGRVGQTSADEPRCEARVEAAGDRVFVCAVADECSHLEGRIVPGVMWTDHAQLKRIERGPVGFERKYLARGAEHHRAPARA